ncbi:hypothetical protein Salat_0699600 [Sesamum alatum]|uniref:Uncharacterized protein n=1 Tax=Sesamum alatum TaxID=300844 RepID=A0AAE2CUU7_9LAMI|nr:hypothetical protein Salat_0699600 [Sesamum alatum]
MKTRLQSQSDLTQIYESITVVLSAIQDIQLTMDNRHEYTTTVIASLLLQISSPSTSSPPHSTLPYRRVSHQKTPLNPLRFSSSSLMVPIPLNRLSKPINSLKLRLRPSSYEIIDKPSSNFGRQALLRPDIQRKMTVFQLTSMSQTIGFAKLLDTPFPARRLLLNLAPNQHGSLPIHCLSPAEIQARRAKGLYELRDDDAGVDFTGEFSSYDSTSPPPVPTMLMRADQSTPSEHFDLSIDALSRSPSPHTLRLRGSINSLPVIILVDSGNSHNIIQPRIAHHLHLENHTFTVPLYLLPIHGADLILGVQWLQSLGPFLSNFSVSSMHFYHHDTLIFAHWCFVTDCQTCFLPPACHLVATNAVASAYAVSISLPDTPTFTPDELAHLTDCPNDLLPIL